MADVQNLNLINKHVDIPQAQLAKFCKRWEIRQLAVFGSVLRNDFRSDSDIDFLADFSSHADWSLLDHVEMETELRELVGRKVDIVNRRVIERSDNQIRRTAILESAQVLYAA